MNEKEAAKELLQRPQSISVIPSEDTSGDAFAAALALFLTLNKSGQKANLICEKTPARVSFLDDFYSAENSCTYSSSDRQNEAVLSIKTHGKNISQLRYEKKEDKLKIYLDLVGGQLEKSDVELEVSGQTFDAKFPTANSNLVITLGFKTLDDLNKIPAFNASDLREAKILNIDNQINNDGFGALNLILPGAVTLCEIVYDLILDTKGVEIFDKNLATILLTGFVSATQNFRHPRLTPDTFFKASSLMEKGANHQLIIRNLYKNKSPGQLRLLGKALERLRLDNKKELVWIPLASNDFQESEASSRDLAFVLEEIKNSFWSVPSILLLWESHGSGSLVRGLFYSKNNVLTERILHSFESVSRGRSVLFLVREPALEVAKEQVLSLIN